MRFLADENFDIRILRGLARKMPSVDIVRVQEVGLTGADDPTVLMWAANENRILITHDVETMVAFAYERVEAGLPMPGVFEIRDVTPIGEAIEALILIIGASSADEWKDKVIYLPFH